MRNRDYSQQLVIAAHQHTKERDFWLKTLAGDLIKSKFPHDFDGAYGKQKKENEDTNDNVEFTFPGKLFHRLMELSTGSDSRLHMILAASLVLLLEKYTNNKDIIIGTSIYKQPAEGEFINTILALRNRLKSCWTFKHLILQVRETMVKAVEHQDYPIEVLTEQLKVSQPGDGFPLFDTAILLENIQERKYIQHLPIDTIFRFKRSPASLEGVMEYNGSVYEKATINRVVSHYMNLCQDVLFKLDMPISNADMLSEQEKKQLLIEFNHTDIHLPADKPIYRLLREQVNKTPDHTALTGPTQMQYRTYMTYISYRELNKKSDQLAHLLMAKGIHPDTIVGIMMEPSLDTIVGILGILKAGGAYLPIDATFPQKRIVSMLKDSNAPLLLTKEKFIKKYSFISFQGLRESQNEPVVTAPRSQVQNLDALQIPDRSMVDYEKYHPYIGQAMMKNDITLQFSRGCTYNCAYCFKIWPKKYIIRSAENMFEEMLFYYKMGVRRFAFVDDLPNIDVKISSKLYRLIIKNKLKVHLHYVNGIRGDILTREYIDLMVEAGTVVMDLALETTSTRLQKLIRKNLNLGRLHENICYILEKYPDVILETAILHGLPTETREEAMASLEYIKRLKWIHFPYIHLLKIYPNTDMARVALEHGTSREAIERSADLAYHEIPETLPFSKNFTRKYQSEFLSHYFLSKERLLKVLPAQMQVFTEAELVQAYDGYLPEKIKNFPHLLDYIGIPRDELKGEFLPDDFGDVPDFNRKLKANFPVRSSEKKALRILLLDLSQYFTGATEGKMIYDVVEPPLGLTYLLTHLYRTFGKGIKGKIAKSRVDFDSFAGLKELVESFKPDVIGVRSLNFYRDFFHETISLLRQWGIKAPIIAGGPYATSSFHTMLQDHHIDLAVIGEGEITLAEITAKILENNGKLPDETILKTIPGIAFLENKTKLAQRRITREILLPERLPGILSHQPTELPDHENIDHSSDLAYIIYTSGSTGIPKGVMIRHNNLVNQVTGLKKTFGFDASLNYILLASLTFDVSVMHIFLPFITGAKLFLPGEEIRKDPIKLWQFIAKNKISVLNIVPAFMKAILENIEQRDFHLKYLFVGGDVFPVGLYRSLKDTFNAEKIFNIYGPTETTINATLYKCGQSGEIPGSFIPIGKPLKNYNLYIFDDVLNPVPIGVKGELYISGAGVGRGYLNNPELTAEKFIEHRSYKSYRSYIYRTGDLTRWLPDGNIEFLGRIDQQVKIRGFRIEPGEIEKHLLTHEAVKEAIVIPKEDKAGNKDLCAYFVVKTVTQPELWPSVGEYFIWDELMYYAMTHDERRNKSFKIAINRLVKDKTVVEIGTGQDAILARFCVEAGAKKVYAIEIIEEYCRKAKQTVKELGAAEKIIVIHGDVRKVVLPEKVDVCLANQCGTIGSSEGAIVLHNHARRFLKEGGVVIPHRCITRTAAISLPENLHQNPGFTELPGNYVEKIFKKFNTPFDLRLCVKNFPKENIISDTGIFEDLHFWKRIEDENHCIINLTIEKDARLDGLLMWLNLYTVEDESIDTLTKEFVWLPVYIPVFYPGIQVSKGDVIKAEGMRYPGDNHFSPDYKIKGVLVKTNGNDHEFEYEFPRIRKITKGEPRSAFYQKIINFDDPRIRILKNKGRQPDAAELRKFLADKLPDYMVPSHFVRIEEIPLTSSGKLDKQALPAPGTRAQQAYTAPGNPVEEVLAELWSEVLGIEKTAIGIDNNFFQLGGHSLKATILLSKIHKQFDVRIPMVELFKTPTIKGLSQYVPEAKKEKHTNIEAIEKKEYDVSSSAQKRLYIIQQMDAAGTAYNMPAVIRLGREVERKKLLNAFKQLIKRHEIFRTSLEMINEEPMQRIHDKVDFEIEYCDMKEAEVKVEEEWSSISEGTMGLAPLPVEPAAALISSFIRPFDLSRSPLMRVQLVRLAAEEHLLLMDMHHIITDAVSYKILERDLVSLYNGGALPGLPLQYKDFACWQNSPGQREKILQQEKYWLKEFSGKVPVLNMPMDYERPEKLVFSGGKVSFAIHKELTVKIRTLAFRFNVTPMMFLLSLFKILLAKYTGQQELVVGTVIAGRPHADLENIIGFFVNMLAIKTNPNKYKTFPAYLQEVKEKTMNAYENQEYQFEELVAQLDIERHPGRHPLVNVIFAFLDRAQAEAPAETEAPGSKYEDINWWNVSHFDLMLQAAAAADSIHMAIEYSSALFKKSTIKRIAGHFKAVIKEIIFNVELPVSDIDILAEEEKQQLLVDFNNTKTSYPADKTIDELFDRQAARTPDKIALSYERNPLTYKELKKNVHQLAFYLRVQGIKPEEPAAIMAENSHKVITGILAILKTGGAYVPLNVQYPEERKKYILSDSNANILLTNQGSCAYVSRVIHLDDDHIFNRNITGNFTRQHCAGHLANIMYTSGSTGQPKGVMVTHRNVIRLVKNTDYIEFKNDDRLLLTGALEFDASTFEIWGALLNGLSLHLVGKDTILTPHKLKQVTGSQRITTMWMTSPLFNRMLDADIEIFHGLKNLLVGGDVLSPAHINRVKNYFPGLKVINGYGPTENTTFSLTFRIDREYKKNIPIGKPIGNSTAYILDSHYNPVPIGVIGELYVGGDGLSRGYMNNPELTAERFRLRRPGGRFLKKLPPWTPRKNFSLRGANKSYNRSYRSYIYQTGDLARWLPDGNIEFQGRIDHQVKIRGYRIEPGEIENHLTRLDLINEAVVIDRTNRDGEKYLCAYIVPHGAVEGKPAQIDIVELKKSLAARLPDHMLPGYIVSLPEIPLTPNGKVDRKSLPEPDTFGCSVNYTAPRDPVEEKFATIWSQVLKVDKGRIGIDSDFFELGGHSLKATVLTAKLHKAFNIKIPLAELFTTPTIRELAKYVKTKGEGIETFLSIERTEEKQYYRLSSAQKRMYILQQLELDGINYNVPAVVLLEGMLDTDKLEQGFYRLIQRHESLRTSFYLEKGQPVQRVHHKVEVEVKVKFEEEVEPAAALISSFIRPFDLSRSPLLRMELIKIREQKHLLMIDMHHIITDGTSINIFVMELMALYAGEELTGLRFQYKDFAEWQNSRAEKKRIQQQEKFWIKEFAGEIPILSLPLDYTRPKIQSFAGDFKAFEISPQQTQLLKELASKQGATLFMAILSITNIFLAKISNQQDIVIGTPTAARRHENLEKIIGMFVNTLALRNYPCSQKTFIEFLKEVKEKTLNTYENQEYQFEKLVEQLGGKVNRDTGRNPLFDVMFTLYNMEIPEIQIPGLKLSPYQYEYNVSKFDLTLAVEEGEENLSFSFEYCTQLFKEETIQRFVGYFKTIVSSVLNHPEKQILEIGFISEKEKKKILYDFNDTQRQYPAAKTAHKLFEEQVEKTPDNIAVVGETQSAQRKAPCAMRCAITYRELNTKSNQSAHLLKEKGVGNDTIVGIMVEPSIEMIIGILGILKAGGAYLPIDPEYPEERIDYMQKDSKAKILLAAPNLTPAIEPSLLTSTSTCRVSPTNLAYVIYTSGSTGNPRGVMIRHHNLVNQVKGLIEHFNLDASLNYMLFSRFTFDVSVMHIFLALITGAKLALPPETVYRDAMKLWSFLNKNKITVFDIVPSHLNALLINRDHPKIPVHVKYLFVGGEVFTIGLYKNIKEALAVDRIINMYGPTEATINATQYVCKNNEAGTSIPIGKPLINYSIYILDSDLNLVPIGVKGELCISGEGVARGYLNNPELTAEKFCLRRPEGALFEKTAPPGPPCKNFLLKSANKSYNRSYKSYRSYIYRTGDLARWLSGGNIEFLGRIDQQVKIRGFRIELGEIENQLLKYKEINEVVVIDKEKKPGEKYLCAYFTAGTKLETFKLKEYLTRRLPGHMIPSYFVHLDTIPLTPSGKTNRRVLPEPGLKTGGEYVAPRNKIEKKLVNIWMEVLGREVLPDLPTISIDDNFFELGGNSLDIIKIGHRLRTELAKDIPVVTLFRYPTIRTTAAYLNREEEDFSNKKKEIFHALDKGKHKLKKRMEKRRGVKNV